MLSNIKPIFETTGSILKVSNKSLMLIIKHKQITENNKDLSLKKDGNIEDVIIKLVLKYNTYRHTSSFEIITNTFNTLYRINKSLEVITFNN